MEASDSEEEIIDINEAKTNSKTIEKNENTSKSPLKKVKWSKTKFSIESISQIVKSENDQSFYEEFEKENEKENNDENDEKEQEEGKEKEVENSNQNNNKPKDNNTSFIYTFIWDEGGNEVKIIGSFSNWKDTYEMKKDIKDNIYTISLPLQKDKYWYKFIVDGEWKYAKNQQIEEDNNGNINNCLDLSKFFLNISSGKTEKEMKKTEYQKSPKKKKNSKINNKEKKK